MQSGTKLGHWVVRELIGKGGMGEVYRARDTKLDRDVALKILPPEVAGDSDRLARFEREAKLLASLNHPNIASIFGIDEADGIRFLVMELVEGRDLAAILKGGPLPVDEAVDVARQIAEGLEEAHEKGIVHRDLKPANVKRTPEGKVKVLDFGLARAYAGQAAGEEAVSSAPTMTAAMTQVGVVLGTAAYMSPEQARGKEVDRRADIWAFGVILFEMLTGKQAFVGETASDTLAGILKSEPEWSALPAGLPFQVERVLRRCLAKDPRQRLRDIGEARVRLQHPEAESGAFSGALAAVPDAARGRGLRPALPWALLGLCLAAVGWLAAHRADAPAAKHPLHVAVPTADQVVFHTVGTFPGLPEISADGSHIVYCGVDPVSNAVQAYVRALDSDATTMLPGAENAQYPFLSPDGAWVAYYDRATGLFRMPVAGGPAQRLCSAANGKGGSWGENGQILLVPDFNAHIEVVPAAGGEPRAVTDLAADQGFNSHRHPQWLPDGKHFLYLARSNSVPLSEVRMADVDGGPAKVIMTNDSAAFYASGHLLYAVRGTLMARPFDPATGALGGEAHAVAQGVMNVPGAAKSAFSVAQNGRLVYLHGSEQKGNSLTWHTVGSDTVVPVADLALYDLVALSPDERTAAVLVTDAVGTYEVWTVDLARNLRTRFTTTQVDEYDVVWGRDSRTLYFISDDSDSTSIYTKVVGSPAAPKLVVRGEPGMRLWDVTPDGRSIIASRGNQAQEFVRIDLADGGIHPFGTTSPVLGMARMSPDGRWLAYSSGISGTLQVYVAPYPAMDWVVQVSTELGAWNAWIDGGRGLVYQGQDGLFTVTMTEQDGRMLVGPPVAVMPAEAPQPESRHWDVTADGRRYLVLDAVSPDRKNYCDLILDWPALVGR